jgi:hypothetical protein
MPKIKKSSIESKKVKLKLKEHELRMSVTSIVDHIKSQVRNVIAEASHKGVITEISDKDLETLTNVVDSTIGAAYAQAASVELSSLYKRIQNNL